LDFPLLGAINRDFLVRPVDVVKTQATDFASAQTVDRAKQDRAATPDLNLRRAVDAGKKLLHLLPRRPLRQIFVSVKPGCVDGLSDARRAPTSTAHIAEKRAQRLYMERDAAERSGTVAGDGRKVTARLVGRGLT
jgi:hypothetical protein